MALGLKCDDHCVLEDLIRAKNTKEYKQWEESIKVGEADMDVNYLLLLRFFLDKAEESEIRETEKYNVVVFDGEDTDLGDEHFVGKTKENKNLYLIKDEGNLVPVVVRYEGDGGNEERGRKSWREKMRNSVGKTDRLSRRKSVKIRIPGKLVAPREKKLDNYFDHRRLRKVVRKNVAQGDLKVIKEAEVQTENKNICSHPVLRINRNKCGCADVAQSSWRTKVHPFLRNTGLIESKHEFVGIARRVEKNKVHKPKGEYIVIKRKHLVEEDDEPGKIGMVQLDNEYLHWRPNYSSLTEDEHADMARCGEKTKVCKPKTEQDPNKGKDLVKEDDEYIYWRSIPSRLIGDESEPSGVARRVEINRGQKQKGEDSVVQRRNVVKQDYVSEKISMVVQNEPLYQKPGPQSNLFEHADQARGKHGVLSNGNSQQLIKRQGINADQSRPFKKYRKTNEENMTNRKNKANMDASVQKHQENFQYAGKVKPGSRNEARDHRESIKWVLQDDAKNPLGPKGESWSDRKGSHDIIRNINSNEVYTAYRKKNYKNDQGNERDDESIRDVEILDGAEYVNKGIFTSFVPSVKYNNLLGSSSMSDEFRKQVLDVLKRPFDKMEYRRHREALQEGSYRGYHPDLAKKLKKYRYKRGKCLNILRGFFFWLQNLTQQGAFKPWKDRTCLVVEPGSLQTSSTDSEPGEA